RSNSS
ncbi:sprT-like family protein, partial [Vibrio parahaemolyticus V-223/04]